MGNQITISTSKGLPVNVRAERSIDDDGWCVTNGSGDDAKRTFYADAGGAWMLLRDGTLGRQTAGRCDVSAPREPRDFGRWLRNLVARKIDAYVTEDAYATEGAPEDVTLRA